jgi:hypothetical protein
MSVAFMHAPRRATFFEKSHGSGLCRPFDMGERKTPDSQKNFAMNQGYFCARAATAAARAAGHPAGV